MKTRFTPLVKVKKSEMDRRERELKFAHDAVMAAQQALETSYAQLHAAQTPASGTVAQLRQARAALEAQRVLIAQCRDRVVFTERQESLARDALRQAVVEYEKFKYLEADEVKRIVQKRKKAEERLIDDLASQAYNQKKEDA